MGKWPLSFLSSLIILNCNCFHVNDMINEKNVEEIAISLESKLSKYLDEYSGLRVLKKAYADVGDRIKLIPLDGNQIVSKMSLDLSKKLKKTMEALKKSVDEAEKIIEEYKYNPDLREGKVDWLNSKDIDSSILHYDNKFKKEVNFASSSVHIPVEIYDGNVEILNGLKWSSKLDKVFQENSENNPKLLWQYFGSLYGYMRMYPATSWTDVQPDLFDVRQRSWFIRGSSSPKTMLILIDISGSMHGLTMSILKMAVKMLLYTLGENDYVNAASFKNNVTWMSCLNTFVPATRRNKKLLSESINNLKEGDMANLSAALEFAFKEFRNFQKEKPAWAGSNCNQMIVILSDGGTDEAWEVLKHYNEDSKQVRIFTYAIGAHPVPYIPLKTLACSYRGYFTIISSMGTIRTRIQEYLKVLSRPMALHTAREYHWTNLYMDPTGLGMLTVVTLPVYNKTKVNKNPSLVGVMGIDVSLKELMTTEPKFQLGFVGYSFATTRNGYLIFHPNLHIKVGLAGYFLSLRKNEKEIRLTADSKLSQATYLDDPPDVDFLDIEIVDPIREEIRQDMINLKTGRKEVTAYFKLPRSGYIIEQTAKYFYTAVNNTSFSVAVVIPSERTHYLNAEGMDTSFGLNLEEDEIQSVILAPWTYCHNMVLEGEMQDIVKNISYTLQTNPEHCDKVLTQRLIFDKKKTDDVVHFWKSDEGEGKRKNIISTFVTTESGLTRVFPLSEKFNILKEVEDPNQSIFLIKATHAKGFVVVLPSSLCQEVISNTTMEPVITIGRSVTVIKSKTILKPAVVAIQIEITWLQNNLKKLKTKEGHSICENVDEIFCYVLDDGGFVVSTNQGNLINVFGKFFGEIDAELMSELYEKNIYERKEEVNYEDQCENMTDNNINAGIRMINMPFQGIIHSFNMGWIFDFAAWEKLKIWIYSLVMSLIWPQTSSMPLFGLSSNYYSCVTKQARYYLNVDKINLKDMIVCNNCTRNYVVTPVGSSNLILVVATPSCAPLKCEPVPRPLCAPVEEKSYNACLQEVPFRRRPEKCYQHHSMEDTTDCSSTSSISLPHFSLLIEIVGLFLLKLTSPFFTFLFNG